MCPPAITASTKWSKQVIKLAGKWKQFLQNRGGKGEELASCVLPVCRLSRTHSSNCAFAYSVHHCITAATNEISLGYVAITFSSKFHFYLILLRKILGNSSLELFASNGVHRFGLPLFYFFSNFILNAMPFKSDNEKKMCSPTPFIKQWVALF